MSVINPIERAVELVGSQAELAKFCGVSQVSVHKWLKSGSIPTAARAIKAEAATGGKINRREFCPDFPWDDAAA